MSPQLLSAISPDESLVAVIIVGSSSSAAAAALLLPRTNNGFRICIWSTITNNLQSTLHYRGDNNNNNDDDSNTDIFQKVLFLSNTLVAVVWNTCITVWDITRGVIAYKINNNNNSDNNTKKEKDADNVITFLDAVAGGVEEGFIESKNNYNTNVTLLHVLVMTTTTAATTKTRRSSSSNSSSKNNSTLKLLINDYNVTTGKLQRIMKVGKISSTAITGDNEMTFTTLAAKLGVTKDYYITFTPYNGLRVYNRQDGIKVSKISESKFHFDDHNKKNDDNDKDTTAAVTRAVLLPLSVTDTHAVTVVSGKVVLIDFVDGTILKQDSSSSISMNEKDITQQQSIDSIISNAHIQAIQSTTTTTTSNNSSSSKDQMILLVNEKELFRIFITEKKYKPINKIGIDIINNLDRTSCCSRTFLLKKSSHILSILSTTSDTQLQLQKINFIDEDLDTKNNNNIIIKWKSPSSKQLEDEKVIDPNESNKKKKRQEQQPVNNETMEIDETNTDSVIPLKKKQKVSNEVENEEEHDDDDDNDDDDDDDDPEAPTVGERLKWLQEALDDSDDEDDEDEQDKNNSKKENDDDEAVQKMKAPIIKNKVTTESLTQLLQQALQSVDDAMLELALGVNDVSIVQTTVQELSLDDISILLLLLTNRIAYKPQRTSQLIVWIQAILSTRATEIIIHEGNNIEQLLRPLQNLLLERLETYPELLALEGRLNMVL